MDNRLNVMLDPCPDPLLAPFYASLPPLPYDLPSVIILTTDALSQAVFVK